MEKLTTLFEVSASEFRTKIKGLGYVEKGSELTSGGNINSDFLTILTKLLDDWKKTNPNCPVRFTAGNDAYHHTANPQSRHTKGEAVDLTLDKSCHPAFITLLNTYKSKYNGFSYLNEYIATTAAKTGDHFHLSYRSGAPEGSGKGGETTPAPGGTTTQPNSGEVAATQPSDTSLLGSFLDAGIKSMGMSESRLEKDINKIKKLLK